MTRSILIFFTTTPLLICQVSTTVSISSSANPSLLGQPITLSSSVTPAQANGKVTFYDGATVLGVATVMNGIASRSTILPAGGVRKLNARFIADAGFASSRSSDLAQIVNVTPATTLLTTAGYQTASTINQHVAVADFNGDGHLDIVTNNYTILMGNGDGTFQPPLIYTSGSNSYRVVTGDFNGDGKPDFATARYDGNVGVWLNEGNGTFQPPVLYSISPIGGVPCDIVAADFNNDGITDIAAASRQGHGVSILLGVGDGSFRPVVTYLASSPQTGLAVADFNGDGNVDIVSVDSDDIDQVVTILLGAGDGTFQATESDYPALFPQFVTVADFNGDGNPDFVLINHGSDKLSVFLGNGDGTFSEPSALPLAPQSNGVLYDGLAVGDFDGDGKVDIAFTGSGAFVSVFMGLGDGTFRGAVNFPVGLTPAGSVIAAEFNGDGKTDLAVTTALTLQVLLGGAGSFPSVVTQSIPNAMGGVPYSKTLTATGGTTPYSWSLNAGTLPVPLGSSGTFSGTPATTASPGVYPFTVMVSGPDGPGFFSSQNLSLNLAAAFQITRPNVVSVVGVPYPYALTATGGTPPYKNWTVTAGSVPAGLTLDPTSGAFQGTPTTAGTFTFTVTVQDSAGLTSLPANVIMLVAVGPDLAITLSHSGHFTQGQISALYNITISNGGDLPTRGTVTVADILPTGLTANSIGGTGWTCVGPGGPCTRSDALAAGASYASLMLTVNVATNAAASVTNAATVSGGNELNTANDNVSDSTDIASITPSNVGIFRSGFYWLEDVNGDQQFTLPPDRAFAFGGIAGDISITGDWSGNGTTKVGIYRPSNGLFILDSNGDGVFDAGDTVYNLGVGTQAGDVPVVGDWNGSGTSKVGLFRQGFFWILDTNGNGIFEQGIDNTYAFGGVPDDVPVVGDWTGSGTTKIGLFRLGFYWILDANGNGQLDNINSVGGDQAFAFGGIAGDVPVVGDWNGDGTSKVGVFRQGFFWVLDANGNHTFDGTGPGQDLTFPFGGISGDVPVVGKW